MAMTAAIRIRLVCLVPSNPGIKSKPSTALIILMAGVIIPSPIKRDMPTKESRVTNAICLPDFRRGTRSSLSTIIPPSPFLPRLVASHAYLTVTSTTNVQTIRERTPITFSCVGFVRRNITVSVYIGLVPMSPKTRPSDFITPSKGDSFSFSSIG